jgi:hypothetical protein
MLPGGVAIDVRPGYLSRVEVLAVEVNRLVAFMVLPTAPAHVVLDQLAKTCATLARSVEPPAAAAQRKRQERNARRRLARAKWRRLMAKRCRALQRGQQGVRL